LHHCTFSWHKIVIWKTNTAANGKYTKLMKVGEGGTVSMRYSPRIQKTWNGWRVTAYTLARFAESILRFHWTLMMKLARNWKVHLKLWIGLNKILEATFGIPGIALTVSRFQDTTLFHTLNWNDNQMPM